MENQQILHDIEEVVDVEPGTLRGNEKLEDLANWDSLAFLSFLAMADARYGLTLAPEAIRDCSSVADLCDILAERESGAGEIASASEKASAQASECGSGSRVVDDCGQVQ